MKLKMRLAERLRLATMGMAGVLAMVAGCGTVPEGLAELPQATAIRIQDDWSGFSSVTPINAHYALTREGDQFVGTAAFSVLGGGEGYEASANVVIPADAAATFLETLAGTRMDLGIYVPIALVTDNYPSVRIEIDTDSGTVVFYSRSQGEYYEPWGATVGGLPYVVPSQTPGKALEQLDPYLQREVLDDLIEAN